MSDSIPLNPGTGGVNLAADEISAIHHQRVKVQFGVDGAATDVSAGDPMPVEIAASSASIADVDAMSNALKTIDLGHHEIHEGAMFICEVVDTTMGASDTIALAFKTPAGTKRVHMVVSWSTKTEAHVELIEGPTWDNQTGTQAPIYNRHRDSATASILLEDQSTAGFTATGTLGANPTSLTGGTVVWNDYTWSSKNVGAISRGASEFILAVSTQYAVRLTSGVTSNAGEITLDWYEHTDVA